MPHDECQTAEQSNAQWTGENESEGVQMRRTTCTITSEELGTNDLNKQPFITYTSSICLTESHQSRGETKQQGNWHFCVISMKRNSNKSKMRIVFMFPHTTDWAEAVIKARKKRFHSLHKRQKSSWRGWGNNTIERVNTELYSNSRTINKWRVTDWLDYFNGLYAGRERVKGYSKKFY